MVILAAYLVHIDGGISQCRSTVFYVRVVTELVAVKRIAPSTNLTLRRLHELHYGKDVTLLPSALAYHAYNLVFGMSNDTR